MESEAWKLGYKYGESCDLNRPVTLPDGMTEKELEDWDMGVTAAVCDRLS